MRIFAVLFVVSLIKAELRTYFGIPCRHPRNKTVFFTNQTKVRLNCTTNRKYLLWTFQDTSLAVVNTRDNDGVLIPNNLTSGLTFSTNKTKLILHHPFVEGTYQCRHGPCVHNFHLVNLTSSSTVAPETTNLSSDTNKPRVGGELWVPSLTEGGKPIEVVGYLILGAVLGGCIAVLYQLPCWVEIKIFICWVRHCGEEP